MLQYKFNNTDDIMNFITNTPEFLEWEVMICRFSTSNGLNVDMNTKIVDPSGKSNFILLKVLLPTIQNFYNTIITNNYSDLNIEIKISLPKVLKSNFDPNNEYYGFYVNAYSDNITIVAGSSHLEKTRNSGLDPINSWEIYYAQIYQTWYNKQLTQIE